MTRIPSQKMVVLRQKVVLVGDGTVGKTAIAQVAHSGGAQYPRFYLMTMGVDLTVKEVQVSNDIAVELHMVDVAGQDAYKKTIGGFIEGLDWFVAVYDITSKTSFENAARWAELCRTHNKDARGVLVANKCDLQDKAETSQAQGQAAARALKIGFQAVSALRNAGVAELMKHIADETARQYEEFLANEMKR